MEPVLLVLAAVAAAAAAWFAWHRQRQRRELLAELADARRWRFAAADDGLVGQLRGDFPLFRAGDGGRRCRNVVHATTPGGAACTLFDYSYQLRRRSGSNNATTTRTIRHAVAVTSLPAALPELRVGPESLLTRLASAVGFGDVRTESAEFNRRFRVGAADRTHAFDVLHPRTIEFLLGQRLDTWEIVGGRLLVTRDGRWDLVDYDRVVAKLDEFVALLPDYVWRKHGHDPD